MVSRGDPLGPDALGSEAAAETATEGAAARPWALSEALIRSPLATEGITPLDRA